MMWTRECLAIGTKTPWGVICAVGWIGERYYWMRHEGQGGGISMLPASVVEAAHSTPE